MKERKQERKKERKKKRKKGDFSWLLLQATQLECEIF